MSLPRIILHAVYFGPLPPCFSLWLHTCSKNPEVRWLLTTDQDTSRFVLPPNVGVHACSFGSFRSRIGERLGLALPEFSPYKLCDFKPTWGLVLSDFNRGFDYWGNCDLDVLWGALAPRLARLDPARYDRIYGCGHLSLYRNTERVNHAFQLRHPDPDFQWHQVLSEPGIRPFAGFDEHQGVNRIMRRHGFTVYDREADVADIHPSYPDHFLVEGPNRRGQAFGWMRGRVFQFHPRGGTVARRELLYLHFQKRPVQSVPQADLAGEPTLLLSQEGMLLLNREPTVADLAAANPRHTAYPWRILKARLRRRLPHCLLPSELRKTLGLTPRPSHGPGS